MESIQALSKGLSPLWSRQIGFGLTFLLCLILFLNLDFNHKKLDQIDLRHTNQDSNCPICPTCPTTTCPKCPNDQEQDKYFTNMANYSFWQNGQYILSIYDVFFAEQRKPQLWKNGNYTSLYNLSFTENSEFIKYKEQQFKDRKERIFRLCSKLPKLDLHVSHTSTDTTHGQYVVNPTDGLGMCRIAKVSSSAWLYRFNMLLENGAKNFSQITHSQLVKMHAQSKNWWNLTKEQQVGHFDGSVGDILSFVMVRHPFDRLVSAYYDKIIGVGKWPKTVKLIEESFGDNDTSTQVTPTEFIEFVINEGQKKNLYKINEHWRPQIANCPFCAFSYDVYAKYETADEDTAYILLKTNLTHLKSVGVVNGDQVNHGTKKDRNKLFWSQVNAKHLIDLQAMFIEDLILFDY